MFHSVTNSMKCKKKSCKFICLFIVWRHTHYLCIDFVIDSEVSGNQNIQLIKILYCKPLTYGKQLPKLSQNLYCNVSLLFESHAEIFKCYLKTVFAGFWSVTILTLFKTPFLFMKGHVICFQPIKCTDLTQRCNNQSNQFIFDCPK